MSPNERINEIRSDYRTRKLWNACNREEKRFILASQQEGVTVEQLKAVLRRIRRRGTEQ
jgi:hypothetical protein